MPTPRKPSAGSKAKAAARNTDRGPARPLAPSDDTAVRKMAEERR